jgi:hypothetical protein
VRSPSRPSPGRRHQDSPHGRAASSTAAHATQTPGTATFSTTWDVATAPSGQCAARSWNSGERNAAPSALADDGGGGAYLVWHSAYFSMSSDERQWLAHTVANDIREIDRGRSR